LKESTHSKAIINRDSYISQISVPELRNPHFHEPVFGGTFDANPVMLKPNDLPRPTSHALQLNAQFERSIATCSPRYAVAAKAIVLSESVAIRQVPIDRGYRPSVDFNFSDEQLLDKWNRHVRTDWCDKNVIGVGSNQRRTVQLWPNRLSRKCLTVRL
jgi:hypothetical protein